MSDSQHPPEPPLRGRFDLNRPTIVALLYLAAALVPVAAPAGLVLALLWREEPGPAWEASHYRWHLRSFAIGLVAALAGVILALVLIGYLLLAATALWWIARAIVAFRAAQRLRALPDAPWWGI